MKRSTLHIVALLFGLFPAIAQGQCTNNNTLLGSAITVGCPGSTSVACVQGGQYVLVNVTTGNVYSFGVCTATYNTIITLFNDAGGGNVGFNDDGCNGNRSVVQWTATFTGQLRVLLDQSGCGNNATCSALDITCGLNNEPCTATTLPVNASCINQTATNVGATSSAGIPAPGCAGYSGGDVWFTATVPATGGFTVTTSTAGGSNLTNGGMAIYSAPACGGAYTLVSCDDDTGPGNMPELTVNCRTPGEVLYIRFWENGNNAFGTFNICAVATAAPGNDDPCGATALSVGLFCSTVQGTTVGSTGSTVANPSCANYLGRDVWYQLTVPANGNVTITTSTVGGSALVDGGMAVYTASACATPGTFTQIACNDDIGGGNLMSSIALTGQTPGQTLYVRVWSKGNATCGTFNICAFSPNDEPCTAYALAVNASCNNTTASNQGASNSAGIPAPGCAGYSGGDVWFTVTVPASGGFTVEASTVGGSALTNGGMAIYSAPACGGAYTLVSCDDDTGPGNMPELTVNCRIPGEVLYVRFWENGNNAFGQFNICAVATSAVTNDDPCSASTLTVGFSCTTVQGTTAGSAGSSVAAPSCANYLGRDVWYQVVVPGNGNLTVTTSTVGGSALTDGGLALYTATNCATPGTFTEIACNDDIGGGNLMSSINLTGQTPGQTFYVRVWSKGNSTCGAFNICAFSPNDEPCTAYALPVNASCTNTTASNQGATGSLGIPAPGCGNYAGGDVWFYVTVPVTGGFTVIGSAVGGSPITNLDGAVYSATACGGPYGLITCNDNGAPGDFPYMTVSCRTPGEVLYVRVWENGNNVLGQFNICAVAATSPANDEPCTATTLSIGPACSSVQGSTLGATNSAVVAPSCANYQGGDVWYQVVVPGDGEVTITTSTVGGSALTDGGLAVYSAADCSSAGSFTEIACNDDIGGGNLMSSIALTGLTPFETLYVRVWQRGNTACGAFNICAFNSYDDPCNAMPISVDASCTMRSYSNTGASLTAGVAAPNCGNLTGSSSDVWFSFTAPASGVAIIESSSGTLTDGSMALYYSASCTPASLSLVGCSADEGPGSMPWLRSVDLVPGGTYYLRYWGDDSDVGTFNLCVWSPAYNTGSCSYLLEMYDSGENGWGSSAVEIQLDAGPINSYTVTGGYNAVTIAVNIGQVLYLSYVNTGPNQGQNRYFLRQLPGGNGVFLGGPTPTAGLVFFEVIDCVPPPPPAEDCRGSVTICNSQDFSNNAQGTGFDVDLRSGTFGCLSAAERQGTWYRFSPSASGTIGLTIAPSNPGDDYDFAIWGPYTSGVCPPDAAPLRCSWSGLTGNTGLGNGAVDLSENSGGDKWVAPLTATTGEIYSLYISNYSQSGLAFNLSWQLSNGASLDCTLLPVELLTLDAENAGEAIEVTWTTASERNSDHFVIERSADMETFEPIGTLAAAGTSNSPRDYIHLDEAPMEGLNYYRVRQVDADGNATTSRSVYAVYRKATTEMVVFPNPAGDILYASFELPQDDAVIYRVLDASGRIVDQDLYHGTQGSMLIDIPLDRLPPGSYTLLVNDSFGTLNGSARFIRE